MFFAIFLQGILTLQAWNYHNDFPEDPVKNKLIVSLLYLFYKSARLDKCSSRCLLYCKDNEHQSPTLEPSFIDIHALRILDTTHLVIICQIAYHFLVTAWGILPALDVATWELQLHILFVGLSCFICQIFFLQR